MVDGHPRQVWWNEDGETVIESYTITDMGHGTPLGIADNDKRYGKPGAFMLEAGISSSHRIADFFGLTAWIRQPRLAAVESPSAKLMPTVSPVSAPVPDLSQLLWPLAALHSLPEPQPEAQPKRRRALGVGAAIARALTAAGLMK
jgi:hypothetical protein